jgi:hypothetical protein
MIQVAEVSRKLRTAAAKLGWRRARVTFGRATSHWRMRPTWIVVGAQRSGTSSLYEYLVSHPLVLRAATEEVHYFDYNYHRGMEWYQGNFATRLHGKIIAQRHGGEAATGEATPYYMAHPLALERIARDLPEVRILVVLRNPVDRAYSHFQHERALGREPLASFAEALDREPERLAGEAERIRAEPAYYSFAHQNFSYITRGYYAGQMERIFALFPRENVMVIASERLARQPEEAYAEVLEFLGLPGHSLRRFPRHSALHYPPMDTAVRARLQELFAPENERLFRLIEADYGWNAVTT